MPTRPSDLFKPENVLSLEEFTNLVGRYLEQNSCSRPNSLKTTFELVKTCPLAKSVSAKPIIVPYL